MKKQKPKFPTVTVGQFFENHREALHLRLMGKARGMDRRIREPTINRPGLALAGYLTYFARHRVQVLGSSEMAFLRQLPAEEMRERIAGICMPSVPCLVIARAAKVPRVILEEAAKAGLPVFRTPMITMKFINAATISLELDFSPMTTEHGSMMEIQGIGVLIRGSSGVGKSECVLGLIERGYSLIADDVTRFKSIEGRELSGSAPELTRNHIEVRGLGIINVAAIFGVKSIRLEKRLDLVVTLKDWSEIEEIDRIGLEIDLYKILGIEVPHITVPVRVGRDVSRLVEVAALDQKLKSLGQNSAMEFNERLLSAMKKRSD
jgi:HPr kinase/phosphorylase